MSAEPIAAAYSAALDEIYALRRALAYEAAGLDEHLSYRTFPKSRRAVAEKQYARMVEAARGNYRVAYAGVASWALRSAMLDAEAPETMTRAEWEAQRFDMTSKPVSSGAVS